MLIFETHAHYDDEAFDEDRDQLIESLKMNNIEYVVNIGASIRTTKNSLELADRYDFFYAAVGVHPSDIADLNDDTFAWLSEQSTGDKVVAIGEIGLDYYWDKEPEVQENQKLWFRRQLNLAREKKLPVVIHSRDAAADTMEIMKDEKASEIGGVIHCFSYSKEFAEEYVKMGFYIGVGGVVTFKNARKLVESVEVTPIERIVLETDCPYLAPEPFRGKRNSSLNIPYIAAKIAEIKSMDVSDVISITNKNAKELYRLNN